ncbi:hypothetical protein [Barnesiella sp. An22]|uniref:hypothetical protein n=1 Tax=Barnesiella sp. An22 TaxID=1965590 RepID=UPI003208AEAA
MTTNYRDRTYSMFNNLLITIMQFTYKYISSTIILLFACTSFLAVISHNEHIWYVYIIPCILSGFILMKRAKKIVFNKESLLIAGLLKKEFIPFKNIHKFEIFKDGFFYGKTLGINIHFRNGSLKKFYIGTLEASCIQKLNNLLNSKL